MYLNNHYLHFFRNRELNELYASIAIRSFAMAMIGLFVPIYLYQLGYSFASIFLFYAIASLTHAIFTIPSARIAAKFGIKHTIFFSTPFLILFLFLLYSLDKFSWPLPFIGIIVGISTSLFWIGYHVDFSKFSNKKQRGKEIGFSKIVASVFSALGPIVGGLILTFLGFKALFLLSSFLLVGAVVPLFFSREIHEPITFSFKGFFKGQKIKDSLGFIGHGIEDGINAVIWPLFIFLFILGQKYTSLGLAYSLTFFFSIVFVFLIGKFSDLYRRTLLKIGSIANAIVWIIRSFIVTPIQVFVLNSFYGLSKTSMEIPFDAISYDKANKSDILKFITLREMVHHGARSLLFFAMIFITDLVSVFRFGGSLSSLLRLFF